MISQNRPLFIILMIFFLLTFIAGGIFIHQYWGKITSYFLLQPVGEEIEDNLITEEEQIAEIKEEPEKEEKVKPKERPETQELVGRTQKLIQESRELIVKIQELIMSEEIKTVQELSSQVKGVYMTEFIANSRNLVASNIRQDIKDLLTNTELNGVVIDVKEVYGPNLPESLKKLIKEFHQKNIWVIARICAFRDSSLKEQNPEWYLKSSTTTIIATTTQNLATPTVQFWRDAGGEYWLDPANKEVQDYIIEFSKKVIDFGFDELQFDYVRFPSEGDLENIVYPFYDSSQKKHEVIREFFLNLSKTLKSYKPSIILSVDLFGYVAAQHQALDIGQRLLDVADTFDYISFMLYPSHFYGGFQVGEDLERKLPALYFPYEAEDLSSVVSNHPYEVVFRSILSASDYLSSLGSKAKIRPWLQDFNLKFDTSRGIYYDTKKVRAQIKAAQDAGAAGWLLWNPSNVYTKEALIKF